LVLRVQALITKADVRWEPSKIIGYLIEAPNVFVTENYTFGDPAAAPRGMAACEEAS
jgi:hypothetical protein